MEPEYLIYDWLFEIPEPTDVMEPSDIDNGDTWVCCCGNSNNLSRRCCAKCGINRKKRNNTIIINGQEYSPSADDWICGCSKYNVFAFEFCCSCGVKMADKNIRPDDREMMIPCYVGGCNRKYKTERSWLAHLMTSHDIAEPSFLPERIKTIKGVKTKNPKHIVNTDDVLERVKRKHNLLQQVQKELSTDCTQLSQQVNSLKKEREECLKEIDVIQKGECSVCFVDDFKGVKCPQKHFACETCLAQDLNINGMDRVTTNGDVKCMYTGCKELLPINDVIRFVPMSLVIKCVALHKEREIVQSMDDPAEGLILKGYIDHISNKILSMRCPECGQVYVDFDGCCALSCSRCKCNFCAWCMEGAKTSSENHEHIRNCKFNTGSGYFGKKEDVEKNMKRLKLEKFTKYWFLIDKENRAKIYDRVKVLVGDDFEIPSVEPIQSESSSNPKSWFW